MAPNRVDRTDCDILDQSPNIESFEMRNQSRVEGNRETVISFANCPSNHIDNHREFSEDRKFVVGY